MQINLLPITPGKKRKTKIGLKINIVPVIFSLAAVVLAVIVTWTMLGLGLSLKQKKLSRLDGELASLKVSLQRLDKLSQDRELLLGKLEFLNQQLKRELLWAKVLNRLSNLVPQGVWFEKLLLNTGKENQYLELEINGSAVSLQGEEMIDLIGQFMTALKNDKVFSELFSEIKLISSQRGKAEKMEKMDFRLSCQFRQESRKK